MKTKTKSQRILFYLYLSVILVAFLPFSFTDKVSSLLFNIPAKISGEINDLFYWHISIFSKSLARPITGKIAGIIIDEASINALKQKFPFKRSTYAQLLNILDKEGARVIGFDLVFSGRSENEIEDAKFEDALSKLKSRVILAATTEPGTKVLISPLERLSARAYGVGVVDTFPDSDGKTRKIAVDTETDQKRVPSFSVMLASAYLDKTPQEVINSLPFDKNRAIYINYFLKPLDLLHLRLFDVLNNIDELKKKLGDNFLKDKLVLVYPEAEIIHDVLSSPIGVIRGGFANIEGVATILSRRFIRDFHAADSDILLIPIFLISMSIIYYILLRKSDNFIAGLLLTAVILLVVDYIIAWPLYYYFAAVYDYSRVVIFGFLFYLAGSGYQYILFRRQMNMIRDKVTLDPLRGLYTLRYFYYKLDMELRPDSRDFGYFNKDLNLIFIQMKGFKEALEGESFDKIKECWVKIKELISGKNSFWAVYSPFEIAGCVYGPAKKMSSLVYSIKTNIGIIARDMGMDSVGIRVGYLKLQKGYPAKELLFIVSSELKKQKDEVLEVDKHAEILAMLKSSVVKVSDSRDMLQTFEDDIEDKNRQLLSLIDNLIKEHAKTKEAYFQIITSLVNALEARDPYTEGHSQRVSTFALKLADRLKWNNEEKDNLKKAGLLHDLGKIGIPDNILHKQGKLTDEEFNFIKKHEIIAVKIIEPLKDLTVIMPWILYHHERWDGKGYPHGLGGDAIPLASQILSIADVFDALVTGRSYKPAIPVDEVIKEMEKQRGAQFNPQLVDEFVVMLKETHINAGIQSKQEPSLAPQQQPQIPPVLPQQQPAPQQSAQTTVIQQVSPASPGQSDPPAPQK